MSLMRILFFLLVWSLALQVKAQQEHRPDTLHTATRMRPNDIFKEDIRWNRASTDLFTYRLDSGLYGFYGPQPTLMLDGIPVDINFFGWQNINMLPLLMEDITETKIRFTPGIYQNTLESAGALDFKIAGPDTGFSFSSSFYIGNESGDPGPYIFDSLKTTPNIDRWGPDGSVALSYRTNNWYTKGLLSFRNHQPSDLISNQRLHLTASVLGTNQEYINYKLQTTAKSGLVETGYEGSNLKIRAWAMYGEARDYLFLQPFGREIPTISTYQQFVIEGNYETGRWLFSNRYIAHKKTLGKRYDLHTYIFNWDQTSHTFSSSAQYKGTGFSFTPGIIYERLQTQAPGIYEPYNDLANFYLNGTLHLGKRAALNLHGNLDYDESQWAQTFRASLPVKFTNGWKATPEFFYSEVLPLRQHSFPYWMSRGYNFADKLDITINSPFDSFKDQVISAKLTNEISFNENWGVVLEKQLIRHEAINIPWQIVEEYEFLDTLPGQFTASREQGTRFKFWARLTNQISGSFNQELAVLLQHTVSGSQRYQSYFEQIPETKVSYNLNVNPFKDLAISFNAMYRSSTTWREYKALDGVTYKLPSGIPIRPVSGTFHTTTPSFTNISVGIQKWFWNRHVNTQFSVQNLLNQEVRYHTMGAELFTKFNIRIGVQF